MRVVLEKVRKNKSRVQKPPETTSGPSSWKERFHVPKQLKQIFKKKGDQGEGEGESADDIDDDDKSNCQHS